MTRKPRSDGKLLTLPEEDQQRIFDWLKHMGYDKARLMIKKELGVKTSVGALNNFWTVWSKRESQNRILKAVTAAKDIEESAADNLPLINKATMAALQQAAFESILSGGDDRRIKDFMNIVLKARALDQDQQALELRVREYEDKIAKAKATLEQAKSAGKGGLGKETIERIEQQLGLL